MVNLFLCAASEHKQGFYHNRPACTSLVYIHVCRVWWKFNRLFGFVAVFSHTPHHTLQQRIIEICFISAVEINLIPRTKFSSKSPILVAFCYDYFNTAESSDWELNIRTGFVRPQQLEYYVVNSRWI